MERDSEADVSSEGIEELIRVLKLPITDCKSSIVITVVVNELEISVNVHFKDSFQAGNFLLYNLLKDLAGLNDQVTLAFAKQKMVSHG